MLLQKTLGAKVDSGTGSLTATYIDAYTGNTSASQTITNVSFGSENLTRRIYVLMGFSASVFTNRSINSITIGGVAATLVARANATVTSSGYGLFVADVPAGISGNLGIVFSGAIATPNPVFFVYRVTEQAEPLSTVLLDNQQSSTASGTSLARTVGTVNGGFSLVLMQVASARAITLNVPQSTTASVIRLGGLLVPTSGATTNFTAAWVSNTAAALRVFSLKV